MGISASRIAAIVFIGMLCYERITQQGLDGRVLGRGTDNNIDKRWQRWQQWREIGRGGLGVRRPKLFEVAQGTTSLFRLSAVSFTQGREWMERRADGCQKYFFGSTIVLYLPLEVV